MKAADREYYRWIEKAGDIFQEDLIHLKTDDKARHDAFCQNLRFGTGGLRGIMGCGPNRMNVYTVGKATQGLANYLKMRFERPSVAIARDSRNMGEEFAKKTAGVLAANGIQVHIYPRIEPTPALSFAVRDLCCSAGICITASHNPAEYNGYKVYGSDGCQITTQAAADIQASIDSVDTFDDVRDMPFEEGLSTGLVRWIDEGTLERFIGNIARQSSGIALDGLKVVYTPLNGAGMECVTDILQRVGVGDIRVVPEQAQPDGNFPTCPYPNPEVDEALRKGLELCEKEKPDLLLATDPDADRLGVAVAHDGEYVLLTGNEVGILLLDYMCSKLEAKGETLADKVVITTVVSSLMADCLAANRGFELRRTLTGFKYIGEQIGLLEAEGQESRFLFGFEESCGYLAGTYARDKDGVAASMLVCEMAAWHKANGYNLVEAMDALRRRYGIYRSSLISIAYPGAEGSDRMRDIMSKLRSNPPACIADLNVERVIDYLPGIQMPVVSAGRNTNDQVLPPADVLEFQLRDCGKLLIRPSGTEAKIKAYVLAKGASAADADALVGQIESGALTMLSAGQ